MFPSVWNYRKDVGMPKALMLAKLGNSDAALTQAIKDGDVYIIREKGRDFYAFKTWEVTVLWDGHLRFGVANHVAILLQTLRMQVLFSVMERHFVTCQQPQLIYYALTDCRPLTAWPINRRFLKLNESIINLVWTWFWLEPDAVFGFCGSCLTDLTH